MKDLRHIASLPILDGFTAVREEAA
jgi:hypothetical protein